MDIIRRLLDREAAVVISFIAAALALAATFGVQVDDAQIEAIKDFVANLAAFVGVAIGVRQSVYSQNSVDEIRAQG